MKPTGPVLRKEDYTVRPVPLSVCQEKVRKFHYAGRGANTATFCHGLFRVGDPDPVGVAWWIPPTKSAALANYPKNWKAVLSLSRLAVDPGVPKNAASFLITGSIRLIRKDSRWEYLLTYADERQGHTGTIYKATNWIPLGKTAPEATWVDERGNMVSRKAGPHTRTKAEMLDLGYRMVGRYSRLRFGFPLRKG